MLMEPAERQQRSKEKMLKLLTFLKEETYSDFKTLMKYFNFKDRKSLYSLLNKAEKEGLIIKYTYGTFRAGGLALWGITNDGIAVSIQPEDLTFPQRFEPYRLAAWTLEHHLDNQMARIILERRGCTGWLNGDRSGFMTQYSVKHRPDALMTLPGGRKVAIETERSLKTKARYQSIMASHLLARTAQHWMAVIYVMPDETRKVGLQRLMNSIKIVNVNNTPVTLEDKHRHIFKLVTLAELDTLDLSYL
ncbi:MobC family replication-relaxation protein [Lelliottia sp. V89_10]|uniref:MobC family replication-relaxation protein n=1 Tax=Lelliottia wanjuensis TaxID=3050585 RepID=UPI00249E21FC|nr:MULTISPECIES: MobC family replication-relaxation protein [unclassified Lelliottia]MDI3360332.1 MobC family replication-relaxation protein [Lelliottia sp. V89_13]MDK9549442.1 MobC family replication-relaxation protein [Lelliottia sp. V89_5]MDK9596143.1 MobC family replication-relaxation protein [Lelliottia sp. V89_10]